jgi:hypothetical protein
MPWNMPLNLADGKTKTERRGFMRTAGFGLAALLAGAGRAADWNAGEKANVKTVNDFCAAWSTRDIARVLPFLADDCVYRMSERTPAANGHAGVTEKLKSWLDDSSLVSSACSTRRPPDRLSSITASTGSWHPAR